MLEQLSKVGPKTKQALEHLKIYSLQDLMEYYPYRYELIKKSNMELVTDEEEVIVDGTVLNIPRVVYFKKHMERMNFRVQLDTRVVEVVIFNRGYLKKELTPGTEITIFGKWKEKKNQIIASQIRCGKLEREYVECIYHFTSRINNQKL